MNHKNQHYIPQSYLKVWCDPETPSGQEPYVWQFSKDGNQASKKAPKNIFCENNMYTIENVDGSRNLVLEHGLSELEGRFANLRDRKISQKKALDKEERFIVCSFIAAMHARTKAQREHWKNQWGLLQERMEEMIEWQKKATDEEIDRMVSPLDHTHSKGAFDYDQVNAMAYYPLQTMLLPLISAETPLLYNLDLAIFDTSDTTGFITSDAPCVWFDSEACKRPPMLQVPALIYKTIEIRFPISPKQMIILNRAGIRGYMSVKSKFVDEINRITRCYAHEYFVVNNNRKKEVWFDRGVAPEDSQ